MEKDNKMEKAFLGDVKSVFSRCEMVQNDKVKQLIILDKWIMKNAGMHIQILYMNILLYLNR